MYVSFCYTECYCYVFGHHHHSKTTRLVLPPVHPDRLALSPGINFKETFWPSSECNFLQPIPVSAVVASTRFGANATFSLVASPRNRGLKTSHYAATTGWCADGHESRLQMLHLVQGVIIPVERLTTRLEPSRPRACRSTPRRQESA